MNFKPIITVIMPCYNASQFISEAINSVINQTYQNWELIIVDDCSSDDSVEIINQYIKTDNRIKLFSTDQNSGTASVPRNLGIKNAVGDYIAFLDTDDIWLPKKLEKQILLIEKINAVLVYSFYEKINTDGIRNNRVIKSPLEVNYKQLLTGNIIGCLTAIYSVNELGKIYFSTAGHEDYIMWLEILKKGHVAYCIPEVLAFYRVGQSSLSSNKQYVWKWTWNIYRKNEKLSIIKSIYYFSLYAVKAFIKYNK